MERLLSVKNLKTQFVLAEGTVKAVDGVSFFLHKGEALGIAGETGSGKSVAVKSIMRNLPPYAKVAADEITLDGVDLLALDEKGMQAVWGSRIAMIFQNPTTFINPLFTVRQQMVDVIRTHRKNANKAEAGGIARDMLVSVGMPDPDSVLSSYPFQLSGGMIQRVMIALALSCNPSLLIADEPTTALDVTIQAQILELLRSVKSRTGGLILITHNLAIITDICDKVAVMYAGKLVEWGGVADVMRSSLHPYTQGLIRAVPRLDRGENRLSFIPGNIPSTTHPPPGCRFSPRCEKACGACFTGQPELREIKPGHFVACHRLDEGGAML